MRLFSSSVGGALLCAGTLLVGCADQGPLAPGGLSPEIGRDEQPSAAPMLAGAGTIRIGVIPSTAELTLGSADPYEVREREGNRLVFGPETGSGATTVRLISAPPSYFRLQVTCSASVATRKAAAEAAGHPTHTEFVSTANCTRLYIGQFAANASFTVRNNYRNQLIAAGLAGTDSFWRLVPTTGSTVYEVVRGSRRAEVLSPPSVTSSSGLVTIGALTYRGKGEAVANSAGLLAGVNELSIEQYLYGVVPRELGPAAFPEFEAQRAQAVAARTYAVAGLGKRAADGYDLLATTADQVYGGYAAEHPVSTRAVDETAGHVATFQGKLITALYHSTSGGHTADNEEAFVSDPVVYLRGIPDAQRGRALEHVPSLEVFKAHANPTSLRAAKEGDFESDWARFHRWTFEWTMQEISAVISPLAGQPVERVEAINVLERGPSGRVLVIEFVTNVGTFTSRKDGIRAALRFINEAGTQTNLPSTLFFIEPVEDRKTKQVVGYRAYGGGFGHGVGLSQTGAVGMAQKGHTFDEILRQYYRGIDLTQWY